MKTIKQNNHLILILIGAFFVLAGCHLFQNFQQRTGALHISLQKTNGSRTIVPEIPNTNYYLIKSYVIRGEGPEGVSFENTYDLTESINIKELRVGKWIIYVDGKNENGKLIASGRHEVVVEADKIATCSILLSPVGGRGRLDLKIEWNDQLVVDEIESTLQSSNGSEQVLNFTVSGTMATYQGDVDGGYYLLTIKAKYQGILAVSPRIESIQIADGLTTSGTIRLGNSLPRFKVANSWGIGGWEKIPDGFYWITGEALIKNRVFATFQENLEAYQPKYLLTFSIQYPNRADLQIEAILLEGNDDLDVANPVAFKPFSPYMLTDVQTGTYTFPADKVTMDITEWKDFIRSDRKIVLLIGNLVSSGSGVINSFSLEVYEDYLSSPIQVIKPVEHLPRKIEGGEVVSLTIRLTDIQSGEKAFPVSSLKDDFIENHFLVRPYLDSEFEELKKLVGVREPGRSYNQIIDGHGTGLAPPTEEEWKILRETMRTIDPRQAHMKARGLIPNRVDLSMEPAFPPIGNQGSQGSCVAFSTAYYVRTYQEAKEHGWNFSNIFWNGGSKGSPSGEKDHIMSPAFLYNLINSGKDEGSFYNDAIYVLSKLGCSSWKSMPYNVNDYFSWPSETAWREAPLYRAGYTDGARGIFYSFYIDTDEEVDILRQLIEEGIPVTISIDANKYKLLSEDDVWDVDNYQNPITNHANTVVGYEL